MALMLGPFQSEEQQVGLADGIAQVGAFLVIGLTLFLWAAPGLTAVTTAVALCIRAGVEGFLALSDQSA
jgi:hypothetical protein